MRQPAVVAATVARTFAPVYTGSTWLNVWRSMFNMAAQRSSGAPGPPLSNAEVAAFVSEWRLVGASGSPLWAQFAARAYGWSPPDVNYLRRDPEQARAPFPVNTADDIDVVDVWGWAKGIAQELDARKGAGLPPPRIAIDRDTFSSPVFAAQVKDALQDDGFTAAFKIPMPACKDKGGNLRNPRPPCGKDGKLRDPMTGAQIPCDKPGDCAPVLVDDPVTHAGSQVFTLLLILGVAWLVLTPTPNIRRRKRR